MSDSVFVACKIPSGLILQLRDPKHPNVVLESRTLEGSSSKIEPWVKPDGIGVTQVDAKFWTAFEDWARKNQYAPLVTGHVFAALTMEDLRAEAREKEKYLTKLEGLDIKGKDDRLGDVRAQGLTSDLKR